MPDINNSVALGVKVPDIGNTLLQASQIKNLQATTAQTQQNVDYNAFQQQQNGGYRVPDVNTLAQANEKKAMLRGMAANEIYNDPSDKGVKKAFEHWEAGGAPLDSLTKQKIMQMSPADRKKTAEQIRAGSMAPSTNMELDPSQIDARNAAGNAGAGRGKAAGELGVVPPPPIPVSPNSPAMQPRPANEPIRTNPDGTIAGNIATYGQPGALSSAAAEVAAKSGMAKDALEQSQKSYNSAMDLKARIPDIAHDIEVLGPSWMGAGADTKTQFAKGWNGLIDTAAGVLGTKPNANMQFDPRKVATAEEFAKEQTRAGMALLNSNFGAGREAASIVQMGRAAVAGQSNTYLGAKYVLATIEAVADRSAALHEFKMTDSGPLATAEIRFNKIHPPQEFTYQSIAKNLPQGAIEELRANPKLQKDFDDHYKVPGLGAYLLTGKT